MKKASKRDETVDRIKCISDIVTELIKLYDKNESINLTRVTLLKMDSLHRSKGTTQRSTNYHRHQKSSTSSQQFLIITRTNCFLCSKLNLCALHQALLLSQSWQNLIAAPTLQSQATSAFIVQGYALSLILSLILRAPIVTLNTRLRATLDMNLQA
jgi:hypothetical protein